MPKRIFAVVSDEDFYAFRKRANLDCAGADGRAEGAMGKALAALAHAYAEHDEANAAHYLDIYSKVNPPNASRLGDVEGSI